MNPLTVAIDPDVMRETGSFDHFCAPNGMFQLVPLSWLVSSAFYERYLVRIFTAFFNFFVWNLVSKQSVLFPSLPLCLYSAFYVFSGPLELPCIPSKLQDVLSTFIGAEIKYTCVVSHKHSSCSRLYLSVTKTAVFTCSTH